MTARRLPVIAVTDPGMVARLSRRYGPQRPASRVPLRAREVVWGCLVGVAAGWVAVEALIWIATLP